MKFAQGMIAAALLGLGAVAALPVLAQKPPQEALDSLVAADGFDVSLFASEPMITNPSAIDVDTHGRVWVAEIQWYRGRAKKPGADQIKVLEDTDGDGVADKSTIFADGLFAPMSVCVAGDKVYVATSPDLWVYEDKNGDLKADGPPTKLLTGFGGHNHDHGAHSLVLGPDHKWWMAHGDTGFNVTGTDGSKIEYKWGAMLRGELDGSKLETVAVNFRNPYEICMSSFGESYVSDNDNDGNQSVRICWIMDGGNYGWFGGPPPRAPAGTPYGEHWHFRGHIPGHVPATLVTGFGSPTGICFYEGDAFGEKYKNAPLHTDAGPREVRVYRHLPHGAGKKATSEVFLTSKDDPYFRPDDISAAPDGSLYVSDWYDGGVGGHAYNNPDQGRIYLLRPTGKKLERKSKPGPYQNVTDAIEGLKSPNLATQYLARERLLKAGAEEVAAVKQLLSADDPNYQARALWLLDRMGGEHRSAVFDRLKSEDPEFRALAVRILRRHDDTYADKILPLADDKSLAVVREVLLALPALKGEDADAALTTIAQRYDGSDRYFLEAINIAAGDRKQQLYDRLAKDSSFSVQQFPLMQLLNPEKATELLTSRLSQSGVDGQAMQTLLAAAGTVGSPEAGRGLLKLVADEKTATDVRRLALNKFTANLSGSWKSLADDPQVAETFGQLLKSKELQEPVLQAIGSSGMRKLSDEVLKLAANSSADADTRQQAIRTAVQLNAEGASDTLRKLLGEGDEKISGAALNALVDLQDMRTLREVLGGDKLPMKAQASVVQRLMETTGGALGLRTLVEEKRLPAELRKTVIAKGLEHPDSNVRVLYEEYIPADQRPKRLGEAIKAEDILALKGDAGRGQKIFSQSSAAQCKNCHTVTGSGESLGPDLAMIGKKYEKATLLETILLPSKAIAPEYYPYLVETASGQMHAGFLVEKTDKEVVLKDAKSQIIRVPADEVEELQRQEKSMMPELVLRDVTAQDAADLLAYLMTLRQGLQPVNAMRVLGPFDQTGLDAKLPPEENLAKPDTSASYDGAGGKKVKWEVVKNHSSLGFPGIDSVVYDQKRGLPSDNVTHYFLTYIDSAADQQVEFHLGSDDGCKVWVNGKQVHKNNATRALGFAQDKFNAQLKAGRNVVVVKVVNGSGPGGVSLAVQGTGELDLKTE